MNKLFTFSAILVALIGGGSSAFAQSAKNSIQIKGPLLVPAVQVNSVGTNQTYDGQWTQVLSCAMQTANQKDLQIGLSGQFGLYTDTLVASKNGTKDSATAEGSIEARVLLDGIPLDAIANSGPGPVVMARRAQTLMAVLGGFFDSTGQLTNEQIQLILDTEEANHFDWIASNVTAGNHIISVEVRVSLKSNSGAGSAAAGGSMGWGSLSVESIRLVKGANPILTP